MKESIYKSSEGEARILCLYDRFQKDLDVSLEDCTVNTRFGATHVLVTGPEQGPPVVITHGGNSINPQGLRGLLPLLKQGRYRVYAPDTMGHPGKSAQVRLSPRDNSYGQWLNDVLDGLGLERAACIGGSFGAGILLRLAAYAPHRITRLALFVPAGIVPVPLPSMVFGLGLPYLMYLLHPSRQSMHQAVRWMGSGHRRGCSGIDRSCVSACSRGSRNAATRDPGRAGKLHRAGSGHCGRTGCHVSG